MKKNEHRNLSESDRMTPEQEVDFILGVTGCRVSKQQLETMLKMAEFDNQRIEEEFGGMY